jgi:hypothetical protein
MGQFTAGRRLPLLDQTVLMNFAEDSRVWCENIHRGSGMGGTTAEISVPELLYDSAVDDLQDAFVIVYPYGKGIPASDAPEFAGYIVADSADVGPQADRIGFTAHTITAMLNKVHVGQVKHLPRIEFKLVDPVTGKKTGLKPLAILRDIFGGNGSASVSGGLPDYWRNRVKLGDTTVLNDTSDVTALEFTFQLTEVGSAVDQILAAYGDVAFRERFDSSGVCYLDFYRIQDPSAARSTVLMSQWDDPRVTGALVQSQNRTSNVNDYVSRVHGYGLPKLLMVSVKSHVDGLTTQSQSVVTKRLAKLWETKWEEIAKKAGPKAVTQEQSMFTVTANPTIPPSSSPADLGSGDASFTILKPAYNVPVGSVFINGVSTEQMLVTAYTPPVDPDIDDAVGTVTVTRGYNGTTAAAITHDQTLEWQMPGMQHVFRRYGLPKCFENSKKHKDCPLKRTSDQKPYDTQVWLYKALQKQNTDESEGEAQKITRGTIATVPTLIEGAHLDLEKGVLTLRTPALEQVSMEPAEEDAEATARTYQETVVGCTFTLESDQYLYHDTGQPSARATGLDIDRDGMSKPWRRDDLLFAQFTSIGFPLKDENGADQVFGCVYFDVDNHDQIVTHASDGSAVIIHDDTHALRTECEQILRERNQRARSYNTTLPTFTRGYDIGQALEVIGESNYNYTGDKITSVELSMPISGDHRTTMTTDNVKPPHRRKAKARQGHFTAPHGPTAQPPPAPTVAKPAESLKRDDTAKSFSAADYYSGGAAPTGMGAGTVSAPGMPGLQADGSIREFPAKS